MRVPCRGSGAGTVTLELLMALAIMSATLTSVGLIAASNGAFVLGVAHEHTALRLVAVELERLRRSANAGAELVRPYQELVVEEQGSTYTIQLFSRAVSDCEQRLRSTVAWDIGGRTRTVMLDTSAIDYGSLRVGGLRCEVPPGSAWSKPRVSAVHQIAADQITSISHHRGQFVVADTSYLLRSMLHAAADASRFAPATLDASSTLPALVLVEQAGRSLVFAARGMYPACEPAGAREQFQLYELHDDGALAYLRTLTLAGARPPSGSCPGGRTVGYLDGYAYVATWYTAGHELHAFSVHDPERAYEVGPGFEVGGSTNRLEVAAPIVQGERRRLVYLATDRSTRELMVIDYTDHSAPRLVATADLPDCPSQPDALTLEVVGTRVVVGRAKTSCAAELYVFESTYGVDASGRVTVALEPLGVGGEVGASVLGLRALGDLLFVASADPSWPFQVWDISDVAVGMRRVGVLSRSDLGGAVTGAIDYAYPNVLIALAAPARIAVLEDKP